VTAYLIRRLLWAVLLFVAVTFVTYVIFFVIPADPARLVAGKSATPEDIQRAAEFLGTDRSIFVQYGKFLQRLVLDGSLGTSFANRQDVNDIIAAAAPVTASLVVGGAILWMLIAVPIGVLSALRPRSPLDRTAMVGVLVGYSLHPVWLGLILSYVFGFVLGIFPIQGYCDFFNPSTSCGGPLDWAHHLVLPWITLAVLYAAFYVRMIRTGVMETAGEDYVRTARAKGVSGRRLLRSHVLRNSMLPVVTMLGMDIALLLGGTVLIESVFGLPGLGKVAIESIRTFDLPVIVGVTVFVAVCVIVFNLIVDVLYAYIDPRIRLA
jgi:peptide/nickel transport system permease protein